MTAPAAVLVLGGTAAGRHLAERLHASGIDAPGDVLVVTSLAGHTSDPVPAPGEVRTGGFGGPDGLARHLVDRGFAALVDATSAFSAAMPHHAALAAADAGVPLVRLLPPPWRAGPGDRWHLVDDLPAAAAEVRRLGAARPFLTVGRLGLAAFDGLASAVVVRTIEPPAHLPPGATLLCQRGPFTVEGELAVLERHRVDLLVTKNSGGDATSAKLAAARLLGLPVVVVERPSQPDVPTVADVDGAVDWLRQALKGHESST